MSDIAQAPPVTESAPQPSQNPSGEASSPDEGANPSPEARPAEPNVEAKDDRLSRKFAAMSRKDREIREREKKLREREARIAAWEEAERLKNENPLEAFRKLGFDFNDITQRLLKDGEPPSTNDRVEQIERKVREYEEATRRAQEEAQNRAIEATIEGHKRQIHEHISSNTDKYELISATQSFGDVWDVIEQHFGETGKVMPIDEASDLVESYLQREAEAELQKLRSTKKLSRLFREGDADAGGKTGASRDRYGLPDGERYAGEDDGRTIVTRTLTNGRTTVPGRLTHDSNTNEVLTREEEIRRAVARARARESRRS